MRPVLQGQKLEPTCKLACDAVVSEIPNLARTLRTEDIAGAMDKQSEWSIPSKRE